MISHRPILIAGFGSVGRRHLQNLRSLGYKNFVLYRTGKSTLPDDEISNIPQEYNLAKALSEKPLATIISNPTALHMSVALAAARAGSHVFLEKPISHNLVGIKKLQRLTHDKNLIVITGFQFRFHPGLRQIKRLLNKNVIGSVVSVQVHWGEYLPGWHPWEDYRKSYAGKADLGGGVLLTLCHPFDYLRWLLGEVRSVWAIMGRSSGLGLDVEDTADLLLQFKSGVTGNVHLDYLERPSEHFIRIVGQGGTIYWNNSDGVVKWCNDASGKWNELHTPKGFERNKMFVDEMRHFLSCIKKDEQPLCTLGDGVKVLQLVLAAKKSAEKGRMIKLF